MHLEIPIYQVDAFASKVFAGNPAAVCPLEEWLNEDLMQSIAQENNLSETAFFVKEGPVYKLRWFTPVAEVDLCGHATLASAYVIFNYIDTKTNRVVFSSKSGNLIVEKDNDLLSMDFPSLPPVSGEFPKDLVEGLDAVPEEIWRSNDYLALYSSETVVRGISPDFDKLKSLGLRGIIITSKGDKVDFVSRFFAPRYGINEDPVTGSAHCILIPFWSKRLNKKKLHALQVSQRGGELFCEDAGDRTIIAGRAVEFMKGTIGIDI
jgi:PhzF family phenazine biosynthesis protein